MKLKSIALNSKERAICCYKQTFQVVDYKWKEKVYTQKH